MLARLSVNKHREPERASAVEKEIQQLHGPIMQWCREHQAAWIHARTDMPSGINVGAPDFVIFYKGKTLLVECKSGKKKLRPEQASWMALAEHNGFMVFVVRSMTEFHQLVNGL